LSNSKSPSLKKSLPAMGKATYSRRGAKTSAAKSVKTVKKIKKR
jgi:hypothetical protein